MPDIELQFFGEPRLYCPEAGSLAHLSPQIKELFGLIVFNGTNLSIPASTVIDWLWDPQETGLSGRFDRLIHAARGAFSSLGADGKRHLTRSNGVVRLVDVAVDVQQFDIAFKSREWEQALQIHRRGTLFDGRLGGWKNDWDDRARQRFGTRICRCFYELAVSMVKEDSYDVDDVVELFEARLEAAITYDIEREKTEAKQQLEKLRALRDAPGALNLPAHPKDDTHVPGKLPFERLMVQRMGSGLSLYVDPEHYDETHQYALVARQDLLDYPTGDFYSIRRLRGLNASERPSEGLIYAESSEVRLKFEQTQTKAFDSASRKPLAIESLLPASVSTFQHGFQILFPRPIAPGDGFDVVFAIKLPGELTFLSPEEEIMSIALVRYALGVERLEFKICLDFEPRRVMGEYFKANGHFGTLDAPLEVEPYTPMEWYERDLDIAWSSQPHVVSYAIDHPSAPMYSIRYRIS
jgi:hypothetical protein